MNHYGKEKFDFQGEEEEKLEEIFYLIRQYPTKEMSKARSLSES